MHSVQAVLLGIIEGITEFLPISSTFHLIMGARFLGLPSSEFVKLFEVVIQSGAIAALLFLYTKTFLHDRRLFIRVCLSFIPTAIAGLLLHKVVKQVFFETDWLMLGVFIGMGVFFLCVERYLVGRPPLKKTCAAITRGEALMIGLCQAAALVPGVSRAGAVILPMILLGYKRDEAARYTFLLSVPTIMAAGGLDLYQGRSLLLENMHNWLTLSLGFVVSLVVAYFVMQWLIRYLASHTLEIFGWYRLIVGIILILFLRS